VGGGVVLFAAVAAGVFLLLSRTGGGDEDKDILAESKSRKTAKTEVQTEEGDFGSMLLNAKRQQLVLNAKSCLTAAQAEMSSLYAKDATTITSDDKTRILDTADVASTCEAFVIGCDEEMSKGTRTGYEITYVFYKEDGKAIYYDGSTWEEVPDGSEDTLDYGKPSNVKETYNIK
jgi:hypothetical protein